MGKVVAVNGYSIYQGSGSQIKSLSQVEVINFTTPLMEC